MITDEFRARVRALREQGKSWPEVSRAVGRPKRTCQRAIEEPDQLCAHRDCTEIRLTSGVYCTTHAKLAMRNRPGGGERQREVMRVMRRLGHATSEELRQATGMDTMNLSQVTSRLVNLGLLERPMKGHYTMPRDEQYRPEVPIEPTPDRIGITR